jgi:hypothetical protein
LLRVTLKNPGDSSGILSFDENGDPVTMSW